VGEIVFVVIIMSEFPMNNPIVFPLRQGECLCGRERLVDDLIQIGYLELVKYAIFL
jgi:hypothetical protein